jgi:hypothetical protein
MIHRGCDAFIQILLESGVGPGEYGLFALVFALIAAQKTGVVPGKVRVGRHVG